MKINTADHIFSADAQGLLRSLVPIKKRTKNLLSVILEADFVMIAQFDSQRRKTRSRPVIGSGCCFRVGEEFASPSNENGISCAAIQTA